MTTSKTNFRRSATTGNFFSVQFLRINLMLCVTMLLLALSSTAQAQIEPAAPGSIEYSINTNGFTWFATSDPITVGTYVEDLLTGRANQPDGRGALGIVTATGFDPDYNQMAATVDFGRDYSAGIVFSELTAVQVVPEPSSMMLVLLPGGLLLWRKARNERHRPGTTGVPPTSALS
jgi:hypothetical protein